jgi:hypothetical protein
MLQQSDTCFCGLLVVLVFQMRRKEEDGDEGECPKHLAKQPGPQKQKAVNKSVEATQEESGQGACKRKEGRDEASRAEKSKDKKRSKIQEEKHMQGSSIQAATDSVVNTSASDTATTATTTMVTDAPCSAAEATTPGCSLSKPTAEEKSKKSKNERASAPLPAPKPNGASSSAAAAASGGMPGTSSHNNKCLYRRIQHMVLHVILPMGRKVLPMAASATTMNAKAAGSTVNSYNHLPKPTSFVFTEEDVLRRNVLRIFKDCPQLSKGKGKKQLVAKFMEVVAELENENLGA